MSHDPHWLPRSITPRRRTSSVYSSASAPGAHHLDAAATATPPSQPDQYPHIPPPPMSMPNMNQQYPVDPTMPPTASPGGHHQHDYQAVPPLTPSHYYAPAIHSDVPINDEGTPLYQHSSDTRSMSPYRPVAQTASDSFNNFGSSARLNQYAADSEKPLEAPPLTSSRDAYSKSAPSSRKKWFISLGILVVLIAGGVGAYLALHNKSNSNKNSSGADNSGGKGSSTSGHGTSGKSNSSLLTSGGDGSLVTMEDGTTFVYKNALGGHWTSIPFDNSAQAQASVPSLNQSWDYTNGRILGVNLGGWLLLEPFIAPALFEPFENDSQPAIDEYTLAGKLGNQFASTMETHYSTFITEQDFAQIAGAGLNWVRIPIPYWAIETYPGEPFVEGVSWTYFLKAITWARKYGLRINLDYHATPGSQNGWNHSSKYGTVNFLVGVMGLANAQRALNYLRTITEFISQPQYSSVVCMFSIMNEAMLGQIGTTIMRQFYYEAYTMIRSISGFGQGNGPMITLHDGFIGQPQWAGFLDGADRLGLDTHPYLCFAPQANTNTMTQNIMTPCNSWGPGYNTSFGAFGFSMAGEWSLAVNDCGEYVNNVGWGTREEGTFPNASASTTTRHGSCAPWVDVSTWSADLKQQFQQLQFAHQDGLQNSFFWTWKVGNTTKTNPPRCANPMWSYSYGLENGYVNPNPTLAKGSCVAMGQQFGVNAAHASWSGQFKPYQTGGVKNPQIAADQVTEYDTWPPTALQDGLQLGDLPAYTPTGSIITAPASTPTAGPTGSVGPGNGWNQASDTVGYYTAISGCNNYLDPWSGNGAAAPANNAACTDAPAAGAGAGAGAGGGAAAGANRRGRAVVGPAPTAHQRRQA